MRAVLRRGKYKSSQRGLAEIGTRRESKFIINDLGEYCIKNTRMGDRNYNNDYYSANEPHSRKNRYEYARPSTFTHTNEKPLTSLLRLSSSSSRVCLPTTGLCMDFYRRLYQRLQQLQTTPVRPKYALWTQFFVNSA